MKALVYTGKNQLEVMERDIPQAEEGEALIRIRAAGICGTDLSILAGKHPRAKAPLIMGHEFSGEIVHLNSARSPQLADGDRVTVEPLISCGECFACRSGFAYVCQNLKLYGIDTDGAFAQYVKVAVDKIYKIPQELNFQNAVLIEPLSVAVHAVRLSNLKISDSTCVLGSGPIGLLIALVLSLTGADQVLICEQEPYRINLAREFGLHVIDVKQRDPVREVLKLTDGRGADIVFEAAGAPATVLAAPRMCRVRGEVIAVAMPKDLIPADIVALTFKELTVKGVRVYAPHDFERAIQIMSHSKIDFQKLLSKPFSLEQGQAAFEQAGVGKGVMRVLFNID